MWTLFVVGRIDVEVVNGEGTDYISYITNSDWFIYSSLFT